MIPGAIIERPAQVLIFVVLLTLWTEEGVWSRAGLQDDGVGLGWFDDHIVNYLFGAPCNPNG